MYLLLLGGTADGRKLAASLHRQGVPVIYSVAGLVRLPDVDCRVVSGGFSQFGGLVEFIRVNSVAAILDATHPYAQSMSTSAVAAAAACDIPCWRFHRPAWRPQTGDHWHVFDHWAALNAALVDYRSVFLTCGQLTQQQIDNLPGHLRLLLRTAVKPRHTMPGAMHWLKAIGPFAVDDEEALMKKYHIDVLVSKNSGGEATVAKLHAARAMKIPVFMLQRPRLPAVEYQFSTPAACSAHVLGVFDMQGGAHAL